MSEQSNHSSKKRCDTRTYLRILNMFDGKEEMRPISGFGTVSNRPDESHPRKEANHSSSRPDIASSIRTMSKTTTHLDDLFVFIWLIKTKDDRLITMSLEWRGGLELNLTAIVQPHSELVWVYRKSWTDEKRQVKSSEASDRVKH